jgi:16S rRNA G527 N7-methylase RsmG
MDVPRETDPTAPAPCALPADWHELAGWLAPRAATLGFTSFGDAARFDREMMRPALALPELLGPSSPRTLCEIGPGSGGLGLALARLYPTCDVTLADRRQRVVSFIDLAIHALKITNARAVRLSLTAASHAGPWEYVCFRALAAPAEALALAAAHASHGICAWHSPTSVDYDLAPAGFRVAGRSGTYIANLLATLYLRA